MEKGICISDLHYPQHSKPCLKIVLEFLEDFQPSTFVMNGDMLDLSCISHWNNGKPKRVENKRLLKDYQGFQEDVLNPIEDILPDDCKKIFIYGNHENRVKRYTETYSTLTGIVELENNLSLDNYEIIDYNKHYNITPNFLIIHGLYTTEFHTKKTLSVYNCNVSYGHIHKQQSYTRTSVIDKTPLKATSMGCLCNLNPDYRNNQPSGWTHGFMYWYKEGNNIYDYYPMIVKKKCIINGVMYPKS